MSDGSLFDKTLYGSAKTNSAQYTFDAEVNPRKRLEEAIAATKHAHNEARVRLEELERVEDVISGISLLSNVSSAARDAAIESIVTEALESTPTRLVDRVKGCKS